MRSLWEKFVRGIEIFISVLFAALVLDVLWGVISRYTPGIRPSDWTEELAIYLLVWITLIGSALAYRTRGHLGVDYFVGKFSPDAQRLAAIIAELTVLAFAALALVGGGWQLVAETLDGGQTSPVLQWRVGYVYAAIPISGVLFCAFAIEHLMRPHAEAEKTELN
jgi:TRAP-type C4-dicarboxylate transport system permease small subunit